MIKSRTKQGYLLNTLVIAILLIGFSFIKENYGKAGDFKLIIAPSIWQCCYLVILAASLNLTLGFLGQLSLGHCGFMAIGAYSAALISLPRSAQAFLKKRAALRLSSCWWFASLPPVCLRLWSACSSVFRLCA